MGRRRAKGRGRGSGLEKPLKEERQTRCTIKTKIRQNPVTRRGGGRNGKEKGREGRGRATGKLKTAIERIIRCAEIEKQVQCNMEIYGCRRKGTTRKQLMQ